MTIRRISRCCSAIALAALVLAAGCEVRRPEPREPPRPTLSFHDAARQASQTVLEQYRDAGTDINLRDAEGATPLHCAAEAGHGDIVGLLLFWGADINATDQHGATPLHRAAAAGHLLAVRQLVAGEAQINATNMAGATAIELAHNAGHQAIVDFLLGAGADFALAPPPEEVEPPEELVETAPAPRRIKGDFRMWTSASGSKIEAEFVELTQDALVLRSPEDKLYRVQLNQLSREDQILARQLSLASLPAMAMPTGRNRAEVAAPSKIRAGESIAARIGQQSGWTVLKGARLISASGNDGDSFHVSHGGKEYIFRLYFVDAAETRMSHPDRVKDQARYFRTSTQAALKLGEQASRFTKNVLTGKPFTVITRWEDARGDSALPRHYAMVVTDKGDLDELLVAAGLVRIYGMPVDGHLGSEKRRELAKLENQARQARLGAWGSKQSEVSARPVEAGVP